MNKQRHLERAEQLIEQFLSDLQATVNIDSGTYTKAGVDRVGVYLQQRFQALGFSTHFDRQPEFGDHLVATRRGSAPNGPRLLLIGHMDTVYPDGDVALRPFTSGQRDGKRIASGPGVLDMKSGLLIGLYGLHLLADAGEDNYQSVTFICNSDEEIGSPSSKPLIEEAARQADVTLVLEPGRADGTVVSARKGSGQYRVEVRGLASHAGVAPQRGRNAILELSYQVQAMQALNGTIPGVSISVGVIRGGERTNVVPDFAYCEMDVRAADMAGLEAVEEAMRQVVAKHVLQGTEITLSGGMRCLPFERSDRTLQLVRIAQEAGDELGLKIEDAASGGASDANTTAIMGVPTLDGLGASGSLSHNPDEYIELDSLPLRTALLAGLVYHIGAYYQEGHRL
ncbi:MAG: M20 family metallopeptidase [Ktedonobacteraceae bacterium]|nr:M20 family metallopeptidase [Ktedonobacteraceae bacterium]